MNRGMTISVIGHCLVLACALLFFARPTNLSGSTVAVEVLTVSDFSNLAQGTEDGASKTPFADKIGEQNPVDDPNAKLDKKEVKAAIEEKVPEPTPKKPDPKPPEAKPEPKPDPIAEALKKDETKKAEAKPEPAKKPEPKKPEPPRHDPRKVADLLNKLQPTRLAAAGPVTGSTPARGVKSGTSQELSLDEMQALAARIKQCWTLPPGTDAGNMVVDVKINLRRDGSLEAIPTPVSPSTNPIAGIVTRSATRAIQMCAPYNFLPVAKYDTWKEVVIAFDASWTRM